MSHLLAEKLMGSARSLEALASLGHAGNRKALDGSGGQGEGLACLLCPLHARGGMC